MWSFLHPADVQTVPCGRSGGPQRAKWNHVQVWEARWTCTWFHLQKLQVYPVGGVELLVLRTIALGDLRQAAKSLSERLEENQ